MKWTLIGAGALTVVALAGLLFSTTRIRRSPAATRRFRPPVGARPPQADGGGQRPRLTYGLLGAATLIAPNRTSERAARVLTLVLSRVDNAPERDAVRRSYGSVKQVGDQTVRTLFVVGRSASPAANQAVLAEGARYDDILQFDFADTYLNLTLKTILGLRWATRGEDGGSRAEYVLKADEDVLVNYDHLIVSLQGRASGGHLYAGFVWSGARPFRDHANKYYVSTDEYAGESYPDYAAGPCYVMSAEAARLVVERAPTLPFLSMEDVFVGICAARAGIKVTSIPGFGNVLESTYDYCKFQSMIAVHGVKADWKERYWHDRATRGGRGGRPSC